MNEELNVLYQSSDLYAPITGVSMLSLFENNKEISILNVYFLDDGISEISKNKLSKIAEQYNRPIFFINTDEMTKWLDEIKIPKWNNSYTTYLKLFISRLLPPNINRILYIDSDTIILSSIKELTDVNLTSIPLAMTLDSIYLKYKMSIGLKKEDKYFNAGVILFNLDYWREYNYQQRVIEYLKDTRNVFFAVDMDVLNVLFSQMIKQLPLIYNVCSGIYLYTPKQIYQIYMLKENLFYSPQEIIEAKDHPKICHFTGGGISKRPWEINNFHPLSHIWKLYLDMSPWRNMIQVKNKYPIYLSIQKFFYRVFPKTIYSMLHRITIYFFFIIKLKRTKSLRNNV